MDEAAKLKVCKQVCHRSSLPQAGLALNEDADDESSG
jgi:hypothetical protein